MIRGELLSWLQFVFLGIVVCIHVLFTFQSFFQNRLKLMELRLAEMLFGLSPTLFMIFISSSISIWLLGQFMFSD